ASTPGDVGAAGVRWVNTPAAPSALADHDTANAKLAENGDTKQNDSPRSSKLLRQMNGLTHRLDLSNLAQ
ncbi:MAG: hypothetical protein WCD25_29975, partial [Pseudolabrys sp.]